MFRQFLLLLVMSLWGSVILLLPQKVSAVTPLTLAVIEELRNLVQLTPQNKPKRQARKSDAMIPGDGLSTGKASLAELRFNDGSRARIGQQAVFRFLPKTRNLRLSNGTALLLIRPGQGQTRINTPNAAAAIRGSALFVRYDPQTNTTIVGALTNSGIQVQNKNASQSQNLAAGQLIVVVKDRFQGLYDFDLRTFYETSNLVRGLDLTLKSGVPNLDPALASVQAETADAVATQQPLAGVGVMENLSIFGTITSSGDTSTHHNSDRIHNNVMRDHSPVENLLDTGQVLSNTDQDSGSKSGTQPDKNFGNGNPGNNNPGNGNPGNNNPVGNPGNGNPGNGNPGNGNPGNGNPGNGNPSNGNPGNGNPGNGNPGNNNPIGNPGNGNPGNDNPVGNPGNGNPGNGNPSNGNPGNDNPVGNPGNSNPGNGNPSNNNPAEN
ncbi:iron dicitrate transport regulator FecR [Scytonema hofmannii PCC 7110]|uniref:Iron dicitrate transport regulator FecR n=2 Tax=Scytonema hofmannii TaxID=34078 RepID=A0A139X415_9CYAN|nr:FecR family protein [Scytonema hofmannii]KYC39362.1 iron dicitrate transport regulator FecR [Scytonema hofmannii PCC 7110]